MKKKLSKKSFRPKQILVKKIRSKNFWQKKLGSRKLEFWIQEFFGPQQNLAYKHLGKKDV